MNAAPLLSEETFVVIILALISAVMLVFMVGAVFAVLRQDPPPLDAPPLETGPLWPEDWQEGDDW